MDVKTNQILGTLKLGKDKQGALWLTHPTDYTDLIDAIEYAKEQAGNSEIGNALANPIDRFPDSFKSTDADTYPNSYPNYLKAAITGFSDVQTYTVNAARERAIVYATPLQIQPDNGSMAACFYFCRWLTSIYEYNGTADGRTLADDEADLARLNAATNCSYMFRNCVSLREVPDSWTFDGVTNANLMFAGCSKVTKLPSGFSGANITNASNMFNTCSALESLPSDFTLANVTTGGQIFRYCKKLYKLPDEFELGATNSFMQLFQGCSALLSLSSSLVFNMSNIVNAQTSGAYNTSNMNNAMFQMFYGMGAATGSIDNHFVVDAGVIANGGGIKFDLYLHHNGFEKLSAVSVASLLQCLYDYATNDPTYANRVPSGCTNGGKAVPTVIVSVGMEEELEEYPHPSDPELSILDYIDEIGWSIEEG